MSTNYTFETVEQIAAFLIKNPYNATRRWSLQDSWDQEYEDAEAGAAWQAKVDALWDDESLTADDRFAAKRELRKSQPKMVRFDKYALKEADGSHWSSTYIHLGRELGEKIASIWTKKTDRWGYTKFVGNVSLTTVLKRLSDTDIAAQVKAAQQAAKETSERNSRNYARERARKLAAELLELQAKNPAVVFPATLAEIAEMQDEVA